MAHSRAGAGPRLRGERHHDPATEQDGEAAANGQKRASALVSGRGCTIKILA